jgi:hypothetical protein
VTWQQLILQRQLHHLGVQEHRLLGGGKECNDADGDQMMVHMIKATRAKMKIKEASLCD